jgi:hypothetical protein
MFTGPNIVRDGLILSLDAANGKSFRGEPTTNLIPNPIDWSDGWIRYYRTITESTFTTEFGTIGYRFINQPSWNGIYKNFNLVNTGIYTFSAWFKYLDGSTNNNGATVYISNYGGGDTVVGLDKSKVGVWQRVSHTINVTSPTNVLFFLISYGGVDSGTTNPDFSSWEVTMPQIESKSYATLFTSGTRGSTVEAGGGWADRSGNNNHGELINGPTFNSDNLGSIEFDGVDDYIPITSNIFNNTLPNFTISIWYKSNNDGILIGNHFHGSTWESIWISNNNFGVNGANNSTTNRQFLSFTSPPYNNWNNLTFVNNSTSNFMKVFLNGLEYASRVASVIPWNSSIIPTIGAQRQNNGSIVGPISGNISQLQIYNKSLNTDEIFKNYNSTKGRYNF